MERQPQKLLGTEDTQVDSLNEKEVGKQKSEKRAAGKVMFHFYMFYIYVKLKLCLICIKIRGKECS